MNLGEDVADMLIPDALEYYLGLNEDYIEEDEENNGEAEN